jgi:uncharacterized membrane-anchored protein YitT (DUF2179 family)
MKSLQKPLNFTLMLKNLKISRKLNSKKIELASTLKNFLFIALGVLSAGFGLKSLLLPSHFIDGGATGISLLVTKLTELPFSFIIMIVNLPFLLIGYRQFGKGMAWSSALAIAGLALAVQFFPYPIVTNDKLLVATFGGFFLGGGI